MAITGRGTSDNPYVVHNYTELKTVLQGQNVYWYSNGAAVWLRVDGTISSTSWEDMRSSNNDMCSPRIELNGNALKIYGRNISYALPTNSYIYNGRITLDGGIPIYNAALIRNVSITVKSGTLSRCTIDKCRIKHAGVGGNLSQCSIYTSEVSIASTSNDRDNMLTHACYFECCDIILSAYYIHDKYDLIYGDSNTGYYPSHMYRCRIRGVLSGSVSGNYNSEPILVGGVYTLTTPPTYLGYFMYECIVSIDATQTTTYSVHRQLILPELYYQCYVNSTKLSEATSGGISALTETQITNGTALRNFGFPVIDEVTT